MKKIFICLFFAMIFTFAGCNSNSIKGTYVNFANEEDTYVFETTEKGKGTFVKYSAGEMKTDKYIRNEWEIIDDILVFKDEKEQFKIYKDFMVQIDEETDEPYDYDLIAPKGDSFDFEIYHYKFNPDGTYRITGNTLGLYEGEYYRKKNIIYLNFPWNKDEEEFFPCYFIYDTDHIIDTRYVWIKE